MFYTRIGAMIYLHPTFLFLIKQLYLSMELGGRKDQYNFSSFTETFTETTERNHDYNSLVIARKQMTNGLNLMENEKAELEKDVVLEKNNVNKLCAAISELDDRVSKSRKREEALPFKMVKYAEMLMEESSKQKNRMVREQKGENLTAVLMGEMDYHISMLETKRTNTQTILLETEHRKKHHKAYLRLLKGELRELQSALGANDQEIKDVENGTAILQHQKDKLEKKSKEMMDKNTAAKINCRQLESSLGDLMRSKNTNDDLSESSESRFHISVTEECETTTTKLAEEALKDMKKLTLKIQRNQKYPGKRTSDAASLDVLRKVSYLHTTLYKAASYLGHLLNKMSTASSVAKPELEKDDIVCNWKVIRKLGSGGFGSVYEVDLNGQRAALKTEFIDPEGERTETLKNEVHHLRILQRSPYFCRLFLACKVKLGDKWANIMIMSLVGMPLSRLRRTCPDQKFSLSTAIRLSKQCLVIAIKESGEAGYRPARKKGPFLGTSKYCSINVHNRLEQGRRDDLWGWLYMLVEFIRGRLTWRNDSDRTTAIKKAKIGSRLLNGCPHEMYWVFDHIRSLKRISKPDYQQMIEKLDAICARHCFLALDPYDWEEGGAFYEYFKEADGDANLSSMSQSSLDSQLENEEKKVINKGNSEVSLAPSLPIATASSSSYTTTTSYMD